MLHTLIKTLTISQSIKNQMLILPSTSSISYFNVKETLRSNNDEHNKIRENIILSMPYIDDDYFNDAEHGSLWYKIKTDFDKKIGELSPQPYTRYAIQQKAGRNHNYDFDLSFIDTNNIRFKTLKLEFKYNASKIDETPQFVSPMKPSQYLSQSFEEYYYSKYLVPLLRKYSLPIPNLVTYLKQVHNNKPKCMEHAQLLYYQGCTRSSKYTGDPTAISFYKDCITLSEQCINQFISITELDIKKLNQYLLQSQDEKIYLLYKNGEFYIQSSNKEDYIIERYIKDDNRYIATTKSGKKIKILLRWKNGNGIAYPAFQIS